jgi:TatD DNase family protein
MSWELFDAHVHLADERLTSSLPEILASYEDIQLGKAVLVGTSPADWPEVFTIATHDERFIPAVGLHPWKVNAAPDDWQDQLLHYLEKGVTVIGEIGLDQWIEGHDIERQREAFAWQLSRAAERNLPTSIHCLKAHEPLLHILRSTQLPERGFKLHAYNGPVDTIQPLLDLGAYFSVNAGQLKPNAKKIYELIQLVPDDRLLLETDAPNFPPLPEHREFALDDPDLCHPGNIRAAYRALAELRDCAIADLAKSVASNFDRYFLAARKPII